MIENSDRKRYLYTSIFVARKISRTTVKLSRKVCVTSRAQELVNGAKQDTFRVKTTVY